MCVGFATAQAVAEYVFERELDMRRKAPMTYETQARPSPSNL